MFARIWLLEPDQLTLRLVASSGLYTHTDGSCAQVPMGAYKVGKIALSRVPFLSNHLPDEPWVKDREWAIANRIQGFAGYPLAVDDRVIGVLATFSHHPFAPEFLEVLQVLCMITTIALDSALQAQQSLQKLQTSRLPLPHGALPLSDQLAMALTTTRLMLVGTESPLGIASNAREPADHRRHSLLEDCPLRQAGVDSLGMHLEVVDPAVRDRIMPGKAKVSVAYYFQAFEAAVQVFGWGQVSTYLLAGLGDSLETLVETSDRLIQIGVYPFVVPFVPIGDTPWRASNRPLASLCSPSTSKWVPCCEPIWPCCPDWPRLVWAALARTSAWAA